VGSSDPEEKLKVVQDYIDNGFNKIRFYDDSPKNVELIKSLNSPEVDVISKLVKHGPLGEILKEEIDLDKNVEDWLGRGGVHDNPSINRAFVLKLKQLGYKDFGTIYRILFIKNATKIPDLREHIWVNYNGKNISFSKTLEGANNFMDQLIDQDLLKKGETFVVIKQKSNYYDLSGWVQDKIKEAGGPWDFTSVKDPWVGGLYRETLKTQEVLSTLNNNFEIERRYSKRGKPINENKNNDPFDLIQLVNEVIGEEEFDYEPHIDSLNDYMIKNEMNVTPLPSLVFIHDDVENAQEVMGKTAFYNPDQHEIVLYTLYRHPKDVLRSYAHEMIHHIQNLEDRLGNITTTDTREDDNLTNLESEAYKDGNLAFRKWTETLTEGQLSTLSLKKSFEPEEKDYKFDCNCG